jgi:predicted RNA methylase
VVTDATACVGGDTLLFSLWFKRVESIEWKHDNLVALRNNVEAFGATNVNIHQGDSTRIFNWRTNVLYIDPPWGGPDYLAKHNIDLWMGSIRVDDWVEEILKRDERPEYIVLKLPRNYNFTRMRFQPNVEETHFYHIRNFVIVLLRSSL